jgi:nucleotide-binding universal stress UspA family protein
MDRAGAVDVPFAEPAGARKSVPGMPSVLIIGQDPDTVDFSDPAIPPGMSADKVRAGLAAAQKQLADQGLRADLCLTDTGETAEAVVAEQVARTSYDCVVIGAGIRTVPARLLLFEKVINAVHRGAPQAAIAFNTRPDDTAETAQRWLGRR